MVKKDEFKVLSKQANLIISDKKNSNLILELIINLEDEKVKVILAATNALFKVFTHFIGRNVIEPSLNNNNNTNSLNNPTNPNLEASEKYKRWMNERFESTCSIWCNYFAHEDVVIRQKSLQVMMDILKVLTTTLIGHSKNLYDYPYKFIKKILSSLISLKAHDNNVKNIGVSNDKDDDNEGGGDDVQIDSIIAIKRLQTSIDNLKEYMIHDDLRYFMMKVFYEDILLKPERDSVNLELLFCLLKNLNMPKLPSSSSKDGDNQNLKNLFVHTDQTIDMTQPPKYMLLKEHKKLFSNLWIHFLKMELPKTLYKSVLVVLHDSVMPYMSSPLQLTDFLIHSYNSGGSTSLLALNGLFILMNSYNLDYPDFYGKLYTLLEPSIFYVQYRARFMYLLDLFLSSTHLPANLVAAFIKKLSRLSLSAPSPSLPSIITLVLNLVIRHPNCQTLIHKRPMPKGNMNNDKDNDDDDGDDDDDDVNMCTDELTDDPFDDSERNPLNTKAMESSLWELKTLQHHYHHSISFKAKRIDLPLPKVELPYKDHLETTTTDLIDKEKHKKIKTVATNYVAPDSFIPNSLNDLLMFS